MFSKTFTTVYFAFLLIVVLSLFGCDRVIVNPNLVSNAEYARQATVDSMIINSKHIEYSFYYPSSDGYTPQWRWYTGICDSFKIDGSQCTIYKNNDSVIYHNYPITFEIK